MRRYPSILVALFSVAVLLTSCNAPSKATGFPKEIEEPSESPAPTSGPLTGPIKVLDNSYEPKDATVKVGAKVEWEQTGVAPHSVTADDASFDSHPDCLTKQVCMKAGDGFSYTFEKAGEYPYYCVIHGAKGGIGMAGKIIVE